MCNKVLWSLLLILESRLGFIFMLFGIWHLRLALFNTNHVSFMPSFNKEGPKVNDIIVDVK